MSLSMSKKERELVEEIPKHRTVAEAAEAIGLSDSYAYGILFRLRRRIRVAEELIREIRQLRRQEPSLTRLLTPRKGGDS